jgi:predicted esterase
MNAMAFGALLWVAPAAVALFVLVRPRKLALREIVREGGHETASCRDGPFEAGDARQDTARRASEEDTMSHDLRAPRRARGAFRLAFALALAALSFPALASATGEDRVVEAANVARPDKKPAWVVSEGEKASPPMLVYPAPKSDDAKPLMLFLHGMCDVPQNECSELLAGATSNHFVACPTADMACTGGGAIWSGDPKKRSANVDAAVTRLQAAFPGQIATSNATLVGFSLGSFVALDVAQRQKGQWKNLILIGAKIEPDAKLLKEAGVESVLLGAGNRDMMKNHMVGVAKRLEKQGVRVRFMGMGDVGHWFSSDMDAWLAEGMAWLDAKPNGA